MGGEVDSDVQEWAITKDCTEAVALKAASVLNKYQLRELKEWMKSDLATFVNFCKDDMRMKGIEVLDFSCALRDTEW